MLFPCAYTDITIDFHKLTSIYLTSRSFFATNIIDNKPTSVSIAVQNKYVSFSVGESSCFIGKHQPHRRLYSRNALSVTACADRKYCFLLFIGLFGPLSWKIQEAATL